VRDSSQQHGRQYVARLVASLSRAMPKVEFFCRPWVRIARIAALMMLVAPAAMAGGPLVVAGINGFNPGVAGKPITWANGSVAYYTDRGALSAILSEADADALVAEAFARWTSIPTAGIQATRAGQLDEDVSGANVGLSNDVLVMPADVRPGSAKAVAIIYDADGQVTETFVGTGAGDPMLCGTNAVSGGPDEFTPDGHIAHATMVINGNCARTSDDLPSMRYQLVRMLGRLVGLGWSQANDNIFTRLPAPRADDYAGMPLMHPIEVNCGLGTVCLPDAEQPRLDDRAALSRLYPVTAENIANFPGKQLSNGTTARIHGSVRFRSGQGMQGVNVVARRIDPVSRQPSRSQVASCVSGFLFRGNSGNPVSGYSNAAGVPFDRFGGDDPDLPGIFDLGGLEIPAGSDSAEYELSVEAVNPLYTEQFHVGPYESGQVKPSGSAAPMVVTVARGGEVERDIIMSGSASEMQDAFEPSAFHSPVPVPGGGEWMASLNGYGDADYYSFEGRPGRSAYVEIAALDALYRATQEKAQPVIGIWGSETPAGPPVIASSGFFNEEQTGVTRLNVNLLAATTFKVGVADYRGDGRPDFLYRARVLYGDSVSPPRARAGVPLTITGLGFRPGMTANIADVNAPVMWVGSGRAVVTAPQVAEGVHSIVLRDPFTGANVMMTDVVRYGAGPGDRVVLVGGANPATPVGAQAPNPIKVRVVDAAGKPVAGASVTFAAAGAQFSPCAAATCAVTSDELGEALTFATVKNAGEITVAATLTNGASVRTTLVGSSATTLEVAIESPTFWIAQGASLNLPLVVRLLSAGTPVSGRTMYYEILNAAGLLSAATSTTDASGTASVTLSVANISNEMQVNVCLEPALAPCGRFNIYFVAESALRIEKLAGEGQAVTVGQPFQNLVVRVTDSSSPPNPVQGASVVFSMTGGTGEDASSPEQVGEQVIGRPGDYAQSVWSETTVSSNGNGLASLAIPPISEAATVDVTVRAGRWARANLRLQVLWPAARP
jgi:Bacterial Ig-like domain (group 1)